MASGSRLSDVIVKLPDRSTVRIERRLVITRSADAAPEHRYVCTLESGEPVIWLGDGKYRLPDGAVAVAVAHKRP
ncbi:hypothetical protein D3C85_489710 [compost metagenome]|jgi:hypothetical protein